MDLVKISNPNVLAMISPMSSERVNGIARYAREHGWNLMIQDRLGHHPLAWHGDGIIATLRSDPKEWESIEHSCVAAFRLSILRSAVRK